MAKFEAIIVATLKDGVRDNQAIAVKHTLQSSTFGFDDIEDMRIGRRYEIIFEADDIISANEKIVEMCRSTLVNMIIEKYKIIHLQEIQS